MEQHFRLVFGDSGFGLDCLVEGVMCIVRLCSSRRY